MPSRPSAAVAVCDCTACRVPLHQMPHPRPTSLSTCVPARGPPRMPSPRGLGCSPQEFGDDAAAAHVVVWAIEMSLPKTPRPPAPGTLLLGFGPWYFEVGGGLPGRGPQPVPPMGWTARVLSQMTLHRPLPPAPAVSTALSFTLSLACLAAPPSPCPRSQAAHWPALQGRVAAALSPGPARSALTQVGG